MPPLVMDRRTVRFSGTWRTLPWPWEERLFSLIWKWLPIYMRKALPTVVLLIKMENTGLCDAFNHFGIVKSSGLWGLGRPWCERKLA